MSLEEGAINYTDLSPNANIQGTQIADKTIRLRNISDDTFGILASPTVNLQLVHNGTSSTGTSTTAHGLSFTPAHISFITLDSFFSSISVANTNNGPNPFPVIITQTGNALIAANFIVTVDGTNITFGGVISNKIGAGTYNFSAKVYLLQESATA